MSKYPESQALFTRLLIEAGYCNENGTFDRKRFCHETGISEGMCNHFLAGTAKLSAEKIKELCTTLNLKEFNFL